MRNNCGLYALFGGTEVPEQRPREVIVGVTALCADYKAQGYRCIGEKLRLDSMQQGQNSRREPMKEYQ